MAETIEPSIKNDAESCYPRRPAITFHHSKITERTLSVHCRLGPPGFPKRLDRGECFAPQKKSMNESETRDAARQGNSRQRGPMSIFKHVSGQERQYFVKILNFENFIKMQFGNAHRDV